MSDESVVKLLLLGDGTVGKSQFLIRYVEKRFNPNFIVTIGVQSAQTRVVHRERKLKVQLWDAAGQEKFCTISPAYYKAAHGALIFYDITNHSSFEHLEYWKRELEVHGDAEKPVVIVGNKTDLVDKYTKSLAVPEEQEDGLSRQLGVPLLRASAKTGKGVDEAFGAILDIVLERRLSEGGAGFIARQFSTKPRISRSCFCLRWFRRAPVTPTSASASSTSRPASRPSQDGCRAPNGCALGETCNVGSQEVRMIDDCVECGRDCVESDEGENAFVAGDEAGTVAYDDVVTHVHPSRESPLTSRSGHVRVSRSTASILDNLGYTGNFSGGKTPLNGGPVSDLVQGGAATTPGQISLSFLLCTCCGHGAH